MTALFIAIDILVLAAIGLACWAVARKVKKRPAKVRVIHSLETFHNPAFKDSIPTYEQAYSKIERVDFFPGIDPGTNGVRSQDGGMGRMRSHDDLAMRSATPFGHGGIGAPDSTSFFNF